MDKTHVQKKRREVRPGVKVEPYVPGSQFNIEEIRQLPKVDRELALLRYHNWLKEQRSKDWDKLKKEYDDNYREKFIKRRAKRLKANYT